MEAIIIIIIMGTVFNFLLGNWNYSFFIFWDSTIWILIGMSKI